MVKTRAPLALKCGFVGAASAGFSSAPSDDGDLFLPPFPDAMLFPSSGVQGYLPATPVVEKGIKRE